MPLSQYTADALLKWSTNAAAFPAEPTTIYVALFNGDPTSGGTEITNTITGSTTRTTLTLGAAPATSGSYRQIDNAAQVQIIDSALSGATADYAAIYDNATAGNLIAYEALTASKTIQTGDEVNFEANALGFRVKVA